MKELIYLPPDFFLDKIKNNEPFHFSRFGDGEVLCMFHHKGISENCDGSAFLNELVEPMKDVFRHQYDYFHCMLDCTYLVNADVFTDFIKETCPNMNFYNGEVWQKLSFDGRITELVEAISQYNPCFIGGSHIEKVRYMNGIGDIHYMQISNKNSYRQIEPIKTAMRNMYDKGCRFFAICAGYTTKILIDELHNEMRDAFMIDFGSVFDPYCGKLSRDNMVWTGKDFFQQFTNFKLQ